MCTLVCSHNLPVHLDNPKQSQSLFLTFLTDRLKRGDIEAQIPELKDFSDPNTHQCKRHKTGTASNNYEIVYTITLIDEDRHDTLNMFGDMRGNCYANLQPQLLTQI